MPRNGSGTYTLPIASFIAGTVIKSSEVNSDFNDIAYALTTSFATTGVSSMTAPAPMYAGSIAAPGIYFGTSTSAGWYQGARPQSWAYTGDGVTETFYVDENGVVITGNIVVSGNMSVGGTLSFAALSTSSIIMIDNVGAPTAPVLTNLTFQLTNGRPLMYNSALLTNLLWFNGGQCRLALEGAVLRLRPYQGNQLSINKVPREIPLAGISLSASNTASTFVYVYAFMNGAAMDMEMSTVAPTQQTETGVQVKSTDTTRTLVGAGYTDAGGAWADTDGKLWVLSYFNRKPKKSKVTSSTGTSITVATVTTRTELSTTFRNQFISWFDEIVRSVYNITYNTAVASSFSYLITQTDGAASVAAWNAISAVGPQTTYQNVTQNADVPPATLTEAALHFTSPIIITSANNFIALTTIAVSGAASPLSYTIVEVMG